LEKENSELKIQVSTLRADVDSFIDDIGNETAKAGTFEIPLPTSRVAWEGAKANIGGITVTLNEFGWENLEEEFFVDMTVEWTRGGSINLIADKISITNDEGFIYLSKKSDLDKLTGFYFYEDKKRVKALIDDVSRDFTELKIEITLLENEGAYPQPYVFTFPFAFG